MTVHFETIWNEAESVSKSYTDLDRKRILRECRRSMDDLVDAESDLEYHEALGQLLFGLCAFCAHLETKGVQLNSAVALREAIDSKRTQLLDPEKPEPEQ